jgi:hypothetical protein
MTFELLEEYRNNSSYHVSMPSAALVAAAHNQLTRIAKDFTAEAAQVTTGTESTIPQLTKPRDLETASERHASVMAALRHSSLNFLYKPVYAEDRTQVSALHQSQADKARKRAKIGPADADEQPELSPQAYVEASFAAMAKPPVHPDPGMRESLPEVLPLLPDAAGRGKCVWVHYSRLDDVVMDQAVHAEGMDAARRAGLDLMLLRAGKGCFGQYKRKRDAVAAADIPPLMSEEAAELLQAQHTDADGVWAWSKELATAPVAQLADDDNFYVTLGAEAARYGRVQERVTVRRRVACKQDPCENEIVHRPAVLKLDQE